MRVRSLVAQIMEICGAAAVTGGAFVLAGLGAALLVAGGLLMGGAVLLEAQK